MLEFRRKLLEIRIYREGEEDIGDEKIIYVDKHEVLDSAFSTSVVSLTGGLPPSIEDIIDKMAKECGVEVEMKVICRVSKADEKKEAAEGR